MNRIAGSIGIVTGLTMLVATPGLAQEASEDERGAYLAAMAGCEYCHAADLSGGWVNWDGQDVYAPNLTPADSRLKDWTREQIAAAITTGVRPDGSQLHPAMPYLFYNGMADADLEALLNHLAGLTPIETPSQPPADLSGVALPPIPERVMEIEAPDASDQVAYGEYVVEHLMVCGACHTPRLETGEPDPARHLAGGMRFEGEWGTVYASNLTGDLAEGIGPASDDAVMVAITVGYHSADRPIYGMPWQSYQRMSGSDIQAVVAYLRTVPPVYTGVPAAQLNPGYENFPAAEQGGPGNLLFIGLLVLMGGVLIYVTIRQYRANQRLRKTDWQAYFGEVLAEARDEEESAGEQDDPSA